MYSEFTTVWPIFRVIIIIIIIIIIWICSLDLKFQGLKHQRCKFHSIFIQLCAISSECRLLNVFLKSRSSSIIQELLYIYRHCSQSNMPVYQLQSVTPYSDRQNCLPHHHVFPHVPNDKGSAKRKIVPLHAERVYTVSRNRSPLMYSLTWSLGGPQSAGLEVL